jgi:hypothetical protein
MDGTIRVRVFGWLPFSGFFFQHTQHAYRTPASLPLPTGLIDTRCSPSNVAHDAISMARSICMREKGSAPDVEVYGAPDFTFPYVPSHLHHMVGLARRGAWLCSLRK